MFRHRHGFGGRIVGKKINPFNLLSRDVFPDHRIFTFFILLSGITII